MENRKKDTLNAYFNWPFLPVIVLAVLTVACFILNLYQDDLTASIVLAGVTVLALIAAIIIRVVIKKSIVKKLSEYGATFTKAQEDLFSTIEIPFVFVDKAGNIYWENGAFQTEFAKKSKETLISNIFPILENADFSAEKQPQVEYEGKTFVVHSTRLDEAEEGFSMLSGTPRCPLYLLHFEDQTELLYCRTTLENEKCVLGVVFFDNYEEVMANVEQVRRSLLSALLERKIQKYIGDVQGVVRKLEKDRFFFVIKQEALRTMIEDKFSILEDIKTVNLGNDMAATLSIGIGLGGASYEKNYSYARSAVDMALARGGDQAIVKEGDKIHCFGGKAKTVEKTTRVKARIKAQALRELVEQKDSVLIMGHPISDLDCIGAAMGIYRLAVSSGKSVHIVTGEVSTSVKPLLQTFTQNPEYGQELFINEEKALSIVDAGTLLVVVDTNRPSYTVCPELLKKTNSIVVMDHHRQGMERIENAVLSYVEPYASSTSEMVAEVIQYYDDGLKLKVAEADAVLAGIVMDTNNFEDKAGVRTFEAAAYLRRCGADVTHVRKIFRDSIEDYKLRAETVSGAQVYKDQYIISVCPSDAPNPNQTVVAAQAANELLEIRGIKASFVMTEFENRIYLSARSIDEVNVQVMMEKLGGGGHLSVAGAQFEGITMQEALKKLKDVLDEEA